MWFTWYQNHSQIIVKVCMCRMGFYDENSRGNRRRGLGNGSDPPALQREVQVGWGGEHGHLLWGDTIWGKWRVFLPQPLSLHHFQCHSPFCLTPCLCSKEQYRVWVLVKRVLSNQSAWSFIMQWLGHFPDTCMLGWEVRRCFHDFPNSGQHRPVRVRWSLLRTLLHFEFLFFVPFIS